MLEQGMMFFKDLRRVRNNYGLDKWAFEVQRHGEAKDPKTTYSILPEQRLTPEQWRAYQALEQHDLQRLVGAPARAVRADKGESQTPQVCALLGNIVLHHRAILDDTPVVFHVLWVGQPYSQRKMTRE